MKTHYATSHNAAFLKYIPSMHLIELKKDLEILSKGSAGYSLKRFFNAGSTLSNLRRINPFRH